MSVHKLYYHLSRWYGWGKKVNLIVSLMQGLLTDIRILHGQLVLLILHPVGPAIIPAGEVNDPPRRMGGRGIVLLPQTLQSR